MRYASCCQPLASLWPLQVETLAHRPAVVCEHSFHCRLEGEACAQCDSAPGGLRASLGRWTVTWPVKPAVGSAGAAQRTLVLSQFAHWRQYETQSAGGMTWGSHHILPGLLELGRAGILCCTLDTSSLDHRIFCNHASCVVRGSGIRYFQTIVETTIPNA